MPIPVKLSEVVDEMSMSGDEIFTYLNRVTGEMVTVTAEERRAAEDPDDWDLLPGWQQKLMPKIQEAVESEDYLKLPGKYQIHEWSIMEQFSYSVADEAASDELLTYLRRFMAPAHSGISRTPSAVLASNKIDTVFETKRSGRSLATGCAPTASPLSSRPRTPDRGRQCIGRRHPGRAQRADPARREGHRRGAGPVDPSQSPIGRVARLSHRSVPCAGGLLVTNNLFIATGINRGDRELQDD